MEWNGKACSRKWIRHFDIKFFCFTDLFKRGEMQVKHSLTNEITANYITKLLVRSKFTNFRKTIMNSK
jgi:hypothetical protein